ncbi:hypothetical protein ACFE04_003586 [Oxalis oulophora]
MDEAAEELRAEEVKRQSLASRELERQPLTVEDYGIDQELASQGIFVLQQSYTEAEDVANQAVILQEFEGPLTVEDYENDGLILSEFVLQQSNVLAKGPLVVEDPVQEIIYTPPIRKIMPLVAKRGILYYSRRRNSNTLPTSNHENVRSMVLGTSNN